MRKENRYRVVTDRWAGFEVQAKKWWFPFWLQVNFTNTHLTLKEAKQLIKILKERRKVIHKKIGEVVYEEGKE